MDEHSTGTDVRDAFTRLTDDGPMPGFTAAGVISVGRQRRRRHALAVGGTSLAVVVVIAAAVVLPATLWSRAPSTDTPAHAGSGSAVAPQPSPSLSGTSGRGSAPIPAKTPSCPVQTDARWQQHLAFEAKLRRLLPPINGTMTSEFSRPDHACFGEAQVAWWTITSGAKAGELQASASGPGPVKPDQYRQWQQQDPCAGYPSSESTCSFTRHGEALVYVTHRSGTLSPPRTTPPTALSKPAVAIHEEQIQVFALWPDGSGVSLSESTAKHDAAGRPALGTLPLTEQQMVEVALNPSLRS